jgi:hypothetical protein
MNERKFATLQSSLPDDAVEEGDDIIVPGGRNVMESLARSLHLHGFETSRVTQHSFYGWEFEARHGQSRIRCLLQSPGPWLLIVMDKRGVLKRVFSGGKPFSVALEVCAIALSSLEHVSAVKWFTQLEYEKAASEKEP